jgi:hypothetical protein
VVFPKDHELYANEEKICLNNGQNFCWNRFDLRLDCSLQFRNCPDFPQTLRGDGELQGEATCTQTALFRAVATCSILVAYQRFEGPWCLNLQGWSECCQYYNVRWKTAHEKLQSLVHYQRTKDEATKIIPWNYSYGQKPPMARSNHCVKFSACNPTSFLQKPYTMAISESTKTTEFAFVANLTQNTNSTHVCVAPAGTAWHLNLLRV